MGEQCAFNITIHGNSITIQGQLNQAEAEPASSVSLDPSVQTRLRQLAGARGVSLSELVNTLLIQHLERIDLTTRGSSRPY